jgi:hypothetical protein
MNSMTNRSGSYFDSVAEFHKSFTEGNKARENFRTICEVYKEILDANVSGKFCIDGHCKTIFMVEIRFSDSDWGACPREFESEEEAVMEASLLERKYPFIFQIRVIKRKLGHKKDKPALRQTR